jgi:hypothetical protein
VGVANDGATAYATANGVISIIATPIASQRITVPSTGIYMVSAFFQSVGDDADGGSWTAYVGMSAVPGGPVLGAVALPLLYGTNTASANNRSNSMSFSAMVSLTAGYNLFPVATASGGINSWTLTMYRIG